MPLGPSTTGVIESNHFTSRLLSNNKTDHRKREKQGLKKLLHSEEKEWQSIMSE